MGCFCTSVSFLMWGGRGACFYSAVNCRARQWGTGSKRLGPYSSKLHSKLGGLWARIGSSQCTCRRRYVQIYVCVIYRRHAQSGAQALAR